MEKPGVHPGRRCCPTVSVQRSADRLSGGLLRGAALGLSFGPRCPIAFLVIVTRAERGNNQGRVSAQVSNPAIAESGSLSDALLTVARRVFWWLTPKQALSDRIRFVAQVMTYGTWEDVQRTMQALGEDLFEQTLLRPPPGVFDERSWIYWHLRLGILPVPPLPTRKLP